MNTTDRTGGEAGGSSAPPSMSVLPSQLPGEISQLIFDYGNKQFWCGAHDGEGESYQPFVTEANEAYAALERAILKLLENPQ